MKTNLSQQERNKLTVRYGVIGVGHLALKGGYGIAKIKRLAKKKRAKKRMKGKRR